MREAIRVAMPGDLDVEAPVFIMFTQPESTTPMVGADLNNTTDLYLQALSVEKVAISIPLDADFDEELYKYIVSVATPISVNITADQQLSVEIGKAVNEIARNTRRGLGNVLICHRQVFLALDPEFRKRFKFYARDSNTVLIGYKGPISADVSLVVVPREDRYDVYAHPNISAYWMKFDV